MHEYGHHNERRMPAGVEGVVQKRREQYGHPNWDYQATQVVTCVSTGHREWLCVKLLGHAYYIFGSHHTHLWKTCPNFLIQCLLQPSPPIPAHSHP